MDYLSFASDILEASNDCSKKSPSSILITLMKHLPIKACSFYSYGDIEERLSLRAQVGLSYDGYKSFQLPLDSTAGESVTTRNTRYHHNVEELNNYRDKGLLNKFSLRAIITVPIIKNGCSVLGMRQVCNPVVGVICLYPNDKLSEIETNGLLLIANNISNIIAQTYIHSVNYDQLRIRGEIFEFALSSTDLSSFCHRLSVLLKRNWGYEGVSIFLFDERSKTIKLKGTTGLNEKYVKSKTFYRLDEDEDITNAFVTGEILLRGTEGGEKKYSKYTEYIPSDLIASINIPVFEPKTPYTTASRAIGVMRITNSTLAHNNINEAVTFGWEDIQLLSFVASVIGVITHLYSKVSRMTEDFERAIHGIQNNLLFVNTSLNQLIERGEVQEKIHPRFIHHMPDCIDHIEALGWQIERFIHGKNPGTIECKETKIAGDVLVKLMAIYKSMSKTFNVATDGSPMFDFSKIQNIPTVYGDAEALTTVFRNLTENSVKYSHRDLPLRVRIEWKVHNDVLKLDFIDNGIGIDDVDVDYIFAEGYKAESAMRRQTVGAGLGLFQCKRILEQMKGDIALSSRHNPTIFTISLSIWSS
ncbi:MAG: sensor histidine kinase [Betaproteobacteria bacterium]|nr:sensor histidine kinase [Betaproteobacteria bacterium]